MVVDVLEKRSNFGMNGGRADPAECLQQRDQTP
jgi:hypothetical protein